MLVDLGKRWTRAEQLRFALGRFFMAGASGHNFECSVTGHTLLGEIIRNKIRMHLGAASRSLLRFDAIGLSSTWMEAFEPAPPALAAFAHAYGDKGLDLRAVKSTVDSRRGVAWCRRSATSLASFEQSWRGAWCPRPRWPRCRRNSWRLTAGSGVSSSCCPSARTTVGPTEAFEASACAACHLTHQRCADDQLRGSPLRMRIAAV